MQMLAEYVCRIRWRFLGDMGQPQMRILNAPASLSVVARRAGCHHIRPDVGATQMPRDDVVNRQPVISFATILAGIIVTAKNLTAR